jgi:hypothetical protein
LTGQNISVLDFDATDDRVHGMQEGRFFHGYYDHHCFLPLYVFCGEQLLVNYLRPSNIDGAKHAWAILALLVKRLRQVWPKVRIIFRGDSGFCRHRLLDWCDRNKVGYIVGLARNSRLEQQLAIEIKAAAEVSETLGEKVRFFENIRYGAASWKSKRRVIAKIEHTLKGSNPRFIVTNLRGGSQRLYDNLYCARGEMEKFVRNEFSRQPWKGEAQDAPNKTHQGAAAGTVRGSHLGACLVGQPVPSAALRAGLHAARGAA